MFGGRVKFTPREEGEPPSAPQPPYVIDFASVVGVLKDILSEVKKIVTHLLEPKKKNIIVAYPQRGGLKTVTQAGTVIINYSTGEVTIPGQALPDKLPRRLAGTTERYKSAVFYVSRMVNARIMDGGATRLETPVYPSTATIVNIDFDRIELETPAWIQICVVAALQDTGGMQINPLSEDPAEEQVFIDEEIRDVLAHNSEIANVTRYKYRRVWVQNTLNQAVQVQIKQNRTNSVTGAQNVGGLFTVAATTGIEARWLDPVTVGWEPYIFIEAQCAFAPGAGNLNAYITGRN